MYVAQYGLIHELPSLYTFAVWLKGCFAETFGEVVHIHQFSGVMFYLEIESCPTELMDADYFTKGLSKETFESNRKRLQGW